MARLKITQIMSSRYYSAESENWSFPTKPIKADKLRHVFVISFLDLTFLTQFKESWAATSPVSFK